jgi:formylglycine-generating enzyme required for sulfatase activity
VKNCKVKPVSRPKIFLISLLYFFVLLFASSASALSRNIEAVAHLENTSGKSIGNFRALIIGINDYQDNKIPDLKTAVNDAMELSRVLQTNFGFKDVVILTDAQANSSNIIQSLRDLVNQTKKDDSVLIYYAGHGELEKITGSGYWVPHNAKGGDVSTYMDNSIIQKYIKAIPARHVFLVADSCFSGTLFGEARSLPPINNKFYASLYKEKSRWGMTSGNRTPVSDSGSGGHSIFAYHFLKELRGSKKPYLTPRDIYQRIGPIVRNNSEQMPITKPIKNTGDEGGEFVFIRMSKLTMPGTHKQELEIEPPTPPARNETALERILREAAEKKKRAELIQLENKKRQKKIDRLFAELEVVGRMKENALSSESKVEAWQVFIDQFSDNNPKLEEATKRLQHWQKMASLPAKEREKMPPLGMVRIPVGEITVGSDPSIGFAECKKYIGDGMCTLSMYSSEGPAHSVLIDEFFIDKYEVTQDKFEGVMGSNPSKFKGANHPVDTVTWFEAETYCQKMGKRLPTEAEWEKAAKAGTNTMYYWGDEYDGNYSWTNDNSGETTHPVSQKKPNRFGLYDMVGNVWEWTSDWYGKHYYQNSSPTNPKGPTHGKEKIIRGGSWGNHPFYARSSERNWAEPAKRKNKYGFRCAKTQKISALNKTKIASLAPSAPINKKSVGQCQTNMSFVSGGVFFAGKPTSLKEMSINQFCIDQYEVTQAKYEQTMGTNPSKFKGENNPVEQVTWHEAKAYCDKTGKRLPTEWEWEKAAKAGTTTDYYWGKDSIENKANCFGCGSHWDNKETAPVGSFSANPIGLYDIAGNVWEWTDSNFNYEKKVLRGGSFGNDLEFLRSAKRFGYGPDKRSYGTGFRCAK